MRPRLQNLTTGEATFKDLDKNSDGYLSREEAKGSASEQDFGKLDKDNDGKLSREEHGAGGASGAAGGMSDTSSSTSGGASK